MANKVSSEIYLAYTKDLQMFSKEIWEELNMYFKILNEWIFVQGLISFKV